MSGRRRGYFNNNNRNSYARDINRETVFFVLYGQATALRCCRDGQDGDGLYGSDRRGRGRHRTSDGSLRRGCYSSVAAGDRRQMYGRVSGRTTSSSVEFVAPAIHRAATPAAGLTDCWRRALRGRSTGGDGVGGCDDGGLASGAEDGRRNDEDRDGGGGGVAARYTDRNGPIAVRAANERRRRRGSAGQLPETVSSNWTVVSNSSLKDVDGGDLRDELIGYDDVPTGTDRGGGDTVVVNVVGHDDDDRRPRRYY